MKKLYIALICSLLVIGYFTLQAGINAVQHHTRQMYKIQCDIDAPVNVISDKAINTDEQAQAICKALNY